MSDAAPPDPDPEFLLLFLRHQVGLRAFIRSLVRDADAAADIFQDVALTPA